MAAAVGPAILPGVAADRARRRRRPAGEPPPLPRPVTITTIAWVVLAAIVLAAAFVATLHPSCSWAA